MWQSILHWTLTVIVWMVGGLYIVKDCARKSEVDLMKNFREKSLIQGAREMSLTQWVLLITGTVICLVSTWIDWGGSKVIREFCKKGPVLFTFQYIYYLQRFPFIPVVIGQYLALIGFVFLCIWIMGHFTEHAPSAYKDMFISITVPYVAGAIVYYISFFRQIKKANEVFSSLE